MGKRNDAASEDLLAYNNRVQDDAFCKALRAALWAGKESCAKGVSTEPGTKKPVLNYQRSR
jgi:phosphopantetheinyl transferase (holo-ACP synthase)